MLPSVILSAILYTASIFLIFALPFGAIIYQVLTYLLLGKNEHSDAVVDQINIVFIALGIVVAIAIGLFTQSLTESNDHSSE